MMDIDEYRGDVAMTLRDMGYPYLADEYGGISDDDAASDRDMYPSPANAARAIARGAGTE